MVREVIFFTDGVTLKHIEQEIKMIRNYLVNMMLDGSKKVVQEKDILQFLIMVTNEENFLVIHPLRKS